MRGAGRRADGVSARGVSHREAGARLAARFPALVTTRPCGGLQSWRTEDAKMPPSGVVLQPVCAELRGREFSIQTDQTSSTPHRQSPATSADTPRGTSLRDTHRAWAHQFSRRSRGSESSRIATTPGPSGLLGEVRSALLLPCCRTRASTERAARSRRTCTPRGRGSTGGRVGQSGAESKLAARARQDGCFRIGRCMGSSIRLSWRRAGAPVQVTVPV